MPTYVWYLVFGIAFGIVLQRSRVCFVSATTEPFITNSTVQIRSILIGILVSSLGVSIIKYLSDGVLDMLGVYPISIPLILGALLFGLGMVLSGCCSAGMFIRLGEGYLIHIFTFIGMLAGYFLANGHYQLVWAPFIVDAPAIFLPSEVGWSLGIAGHIIVIVLLYFVALKQDAKVSISNSSALLIGATLLGILIVLHYIVLDSSWSVTGAFFWIGEFFKSFVGDNSSLNDNPEMIATAIAPNLRNLGLFLGAFLSALLRRRFKIQKIRSFKQVCISLIGGIFMGYGACIAGGCSVSSFFTAAASLSLSGWIFMICLFVGAFIGTKILYRLL